MTSRLKKWIIMSLNLTGNDSFLIRFDLFEATVTEDNKQGGRNRAYLADLKTFSNSKLWGTFWC